MNLAVGGRQWSASRPSPFIPGKEHHSILIRGLGGPLNRCGRFGEEINLLPLPEVPRYAVSSLTTTLSNLLRLQQIRENDTAVLEFTEDKIPSPPLPPCESLTHSLTNSEKNIYKARRGAKDIYKHQV